MREKHVYLGRFAPFHNGHKKLLSALINKVDIKNVLVLVGSSNAISKRTPYGYEDRKKIIATSFPDIEILPLPDGKPNLEHFDGSTNEQWLKSIEELAMSRGERFKFYGGLEQDLKILAEKFETEILINRCDMKNVCSATEVRKLIEDKDYKNLEKFVDIKAMDLIINCYKNI